MHWSLYLAPNQTLRWAIFDGWNVWPFFCVVIELEVNGLLCKFWREILGWFQSKDKVYRFLNFTVTYC